MARHYRWLVVIILISLFSFWVSLPDTTGVKLDLDNNGTPEFELDVKQSLGLDLVGGLRVLLQAELPPDQFTVEDLRETANNVGRRVNGLGLTEATVQVQGNSRILVELPGVTDPKEAIETIQQTALLEFVNFSGVGNVRDYEGKKIRTTEQLRIQQARVAAAPEGTVVADLEGEVNPTTGLPFETVMTGAGLQAAQPKYDTNARRWLIQFELTPEGGKVFGPYTGANINQPMAIVLDGVVLSAPTIQAQLDTGGVIQGQFTEEEARQLALQLRSGALPIPLRVESSAFVGATLGQDSVNLSVRAGVIGVIIVLAFMLIYYRVPGIAADIALGVFILLNLAIFKLVPITVTLPAITGFLISIGTAVDGNILIFERVKEELRTGKELKEALDAGFDRAWVSIRDSNFSTIIICGVLFLFGLTPGASIVSGFAVTLALGLVVNLFTAVTVTRTFLYLFAGGLRQTLTERKWLLGA
ncbi:MAG TPA: protein translocase subunit SecD [Phototrophicaceae bacterium]|jgi:protein-export membrane protein SecD|nr:protein translocase subunit SecD [Phototrophicaceae bacterium]